MLQRSRLNSVLVTGNGAIAKMLRRVLAVFSATDIELTQLFNSTPCIPTIHVTDPEHYQLFEGQIIWIIIFILSQSYVLRLRYIICSVVYPDVAKAKLIFIYKGWNSNIIHLICSICTICINNSYNIFHDLSKPPVKYEISNQIWCKNANCTAMSWSQWQRNCLNARFLFA